MEKEEFRPVTYPNIQKDRYMISNYGKVFDIKKDKIRKINFRDKNGYVKIHLRDNDNVRRYIGVHRLVAWEFCKGFDETVGRIIVNHKDSNTENNYFENLEWTTYSENNLHAVDHGNNYCRGISNNNNVYSEETIREICNMLTQKLSMMKIMNFYGYKEKKENNSFYALIIAIKHRKLWNHINKEYNY